MLEISRATVKRLVARYPGLYKFSKQAYERLKMHLDERRFRAAHADASFIYFDSSRIKDLKARGFYSQCGQDFYLYNEVFSKKKKGYFVEIGANDPCWNSNSAFLEHQGWTGISFEPQRRFASAWASKRRTPIHHVAISDNDTAMNFVEFEGTWEHQISGFDMNVRAEDLAIFKHRTYSVDCRPLKSFLPSDQHVDLLMIDVEGAEESVLRGVDLEVVTPDYVLIENDSEIGGSESIRQYLGARGYKVIARIGATDDLFRHSSLVQ